MSFLPDQLSPVHTGDYSRRIRRLSATICRRIPRQSPNSATVAENGDYSVDRALVLTQIILVSLANQVHVGYKREELTQTVKLTLTGRLLEVLSGKANSKSI